MEDFIRTLSIRSYYYECLYRATLSINVKNISNKHSKENVKQAKKLLSQELTLALAFIYKYLFKAPFKRDRLYNCEKLSYEAKKLFNNMLKSDIIQNKMHCYNGKSHIFENENLVLGKIIN